MQLGRWLCKNSLCGFIAASSVRYGCDENDHRRRHSLGTTDPYLAKARLASFKSQLRTEAGLNAGSPSIGEVFEAYLNDRASEGKSVVRIKYAWKRLGAAFADLPAVDLSKSIVRNYIHSRVDAGAGNGTVHTKLTYLRAALSFAVRERRLAQAPYIPVPQKPAPRSGHLTRDEARRLLDAATMRHLKLFIRLALATAGRASALLELTWDRVDFEARRISLRDPAKYQTRKGRAIVPINDTLYQALLEARRVTLTPYVIKYAGERVLSVKKGIAGAARHAKVKCGPHVLRHTAAVWMAEGGVPILQISQYLGHSDSRITEHVYARFSPSFLALAARTLEL
jgi:integrase